MNKLFESTKTFGKNVEESATTFGKTVKDAFTGHHHDEAVHAKKEEILREQQKMGETLSEKLDKNIAAAAEKKDEVVKAVSEKAHSFNKDVEEGHARAELRSAISHAEKLGEKTEHEMKQGLAEAKRAESLHDIVDKQEHLQTGQ